MSSLRPMNELSLIENALASDHAQMVLQRTKNDLKAVIHFRGRRITARGSSLIDALRALELELTEDEELSIHG